MLTKAIFVVLCGGTALAILAVFVWLKTDSDLPRADFHDDDMLSEHLESSLRP